MNRWTKDKDGAQWFCVVGKLVVVVCRDRLDGRPIVTAWKPNRIELPRDTGTFLDQIHGPIPLRRGAQIERRDSRRWTDKTLLAWARKAVTQNLERWMELSARRSTA